MDDKVKEKRKTKKMHAKIEVTLAHPTLNCWHLNLKWALPFYYIVSVLFSFSFFIHFLLLLLLLLILTPQVHYYLQEHLKFLDLKKKILFL